jgi:hypothetical protein
MRIGTLIAIVLIAAGGFGFYYFSQRKAGIPAPGSEGDSKAPDEASGAQQDSETPVSMVDLDKLAKKIPGYSPGSNNGGSNNNGGDNNNNGGSGDDSDSSDSGFQPDPNKEFFVNKVGLLAIPQSDSEKIRRTTDWMEGNYRTDINKLTNFRRKDLKLTPGGNKLPRRQQALGLALAFLYQANYIDNATAKKVGKKDIKNFMTWWNNNPRNNKSYPGGALRSYFPNDLMKKFRRHRQARLQAGSSGLSA